MEKGEQTPALPFRSCAPWRELGFLFHPPPHTCVYSIFLSPENHGGHETGGRDPAGQEVEEQTMHAGPRELCSEAQTQRPEVKGDWT